MLPLTLFCAPWGCTATQRTQNRKPARCSSNASDLHVRVLHNPSVLSSASTSAISQRTVLMVPDFLTDTRLYEALANEQALSQARLVSVDLRGHGLSPWPEAKYRHSDDLVAVAKDLFDEAGELHLVGCGHGGTHCLEACLVTPKMFRSVTVIGSGLPGHAWDKSAYMMLDDTIEHPQAAVAEFIRRSASWVDTLKNSDRTVTAVLKSMVSSYSGRHFQRDDPERSASGDPLAMRIKNLQVPVLTVVGARDCKDFRAIAREIHDAALMPAYDAPLTIEGSGHFCALEKPREVAKSLVEFWDSLDVA